MHVPFSIFPFTLFLQSMAEVEESKKDRRSLARKQYDELVAIREQNERLVKVINDLVEAVRPVIKNTDELVLKASTNSHPSTPSRDFEIEEELPEQQERDKCCDYEVMKCPNGDVKAFHEKGDCKNGHDVVTILHHKTHTPPRAGDEVSMRASQPGTGLVDSLTLSYSS